MMKYWFLPARALRWLLPLLLTAGLWAADASSGASLPPAPSLEYNANLRNGFSIRHARHQEVGSNTRLFFSSAADSGYTDVPTEDILGFEPAPAILSEPAAPRPAVPDLIKAASQKHAIDVDLLSSVIHAESGFNPNAISSKGAQGLMQLMPDTASKLGVKNAFEPGENIDAGTRYLRELLVRYNNDLIKALAAYNAGPQRVEQYHGVPPYRETHVYVARIVREFNRKKLVESRQSAAGAAEPVKVHRNPASSPASAPANSQ
ncbi:MAG TPA: lytic transglycosylase domain-containing protein [Terriglobales bacterium]|nr:lytic transglycosylase domain-containing protein [Terriglobales bacterium]